MQSFLTDQANLYKDSSIIYIIIISVVEEYLVPKFMQSVLTGFCFAAIFVVIGLAIYTDNYINKKVQFSWSYGAGWSATAMYIISVILLLADK